MMLDKLADLENQLATGICNALLFSGCRKGSTWGCKRVHIASWHHCHITMLDVLVKVVRLKIVIDELLDVAVIIACMHMAGRIAFEFGNKPLQNDKPGADTRKIGAEPQSLWLGRLIR